MTRLRYFVAIAVAFVGLNIGMSAQPAGAMCVVNPLPDGPNCLPVPCPASLSKLGIYCLA
jgi:hypothetical protein